jgi:tetratricopeptide (TPR) repeat protein
MPLVGVFRRLLGRRPAASGTAQVPRDAGSVPALEVVLYGGSHDLEVVGESHYQDELWHIVGGRTTDRVRTDVKAVLVAESDNPYDANAISVWIRGMRVGYLSREDAAEYRPGLLTLQAKERRSIALAGVIVGGGIRADGPGRLGVWLSCDPGDFGVAIVAPPVPETIQGTIRTGLSQALATDEQDESYDLSWLEQLPSDHIAAIRRLRELLDHDPDPIDRHYMFCELEWRLYRSRDAFASALDEYDEACRRHDAEMNGIRDALLAKFGKVPLLETYTQMAIRQQKAKNWREAIQWAQRGVALYEDHAARPEAIDDLKKRIAAYNSKLQRQDPPDRQQPHTPPATSRAERPGIETLTCETCGKNFQRPLARGRKPKQCPECRTPSM